MNEFEKGIEKYIGIDALSRIRSVHVGIAGAGGLGSNCAFNLVRSGFRKFTIVDFDHVEYSNLNRQFFFARQVGKSKVEMLKENLLAINPDIELEVIHDRVDEDNIEDFFYQCDVVVEAFDQPESKKMIVEKYMQSEKLLVAASGIGGWGDFDGIIVKKVRDTFFIVGDNVSEVSKTCPPLSPGVNVAAAKQADIVFTYIMSEYKREQANE
jgi:sulfur carrier protein ThiS adenylyltransferase